MSSAGSTCRSRESSFRPLAGSQPSTNCDFPCRHDRTHEFGVVVLLFKYRQPHCCSLAICIADLANANGKEQFGQADSHRTVNVQFDRFAAENSAARSRLS